MGKGYILIVDDEESIVRTISGVLHDEGFKVLCARDGKEALHLINSQPPDVILLDIWLPGMDGIETLQMLKETHSRIEVIVMSGHGNIETAVKVTKLGAFDYIEKPLSLDALLLAVDRALNRCEGGHNMSRQLLLSGQTNIFTGDSPQMQLIRQLVEKARTSDVPVLIQGETGSEKELIARLLHYGSDRREGPFVQCQCTPLSGPADQLLFGLAGGDVESRETIPIKGCLELANGGTIFLHDIDLLQHEIQRKLLRVLETRTIKRVRGNIPIPLNVRLIASCTVGLGRLQDQGLVLPEFAAQLRQIYIEVPPLRERKEGIPALTQYFLRVCAEEYGCPPKEIDDDAMATLLNYMWPENVKELKNVLECMINTSATNRLGRHDVPLTIQGASSHKHHLNHTEPTLYQGTKRDSFGTFFLPSEHCLQEKIVAYRTRPLTDQSVQLKQRTLSRSVVLYGQGLQSGLKTGIILSPLPPNYGIIFSNITSGETLPASVDFVASTDFCTSLHKGRIAARTVEHILSVLHAYRISNLLVKISDEIPIMDGSAADFCQLVEEGGIEEQDARVEEFVVDQCYHVGDIQSDTKFILVEPYDGLRVTYRLHYPPPLGIQEFTYEHRDGASYRHEVALARTFAFVRDVEKMHELGLVAGGRLNNVILIDDEKIINNVQMRFPDECARHKVLDILGDLYLLGKPLRGYVRANMTGHTENVALVKQLRAAILLA
jgi:two-component system nitrogen regulation response regulator NtrX